MSYKIFVIASLFAGVCLVAPLAYAAQPSTPVNGKPTTSKQWRQNRIRTVYRQLGLTGDQKQQLRINRQKERSARKNLFEKMRSSREALNRELMQPDLNMGKINEIQSQFKALQAQMVDDRLNSILEVRRILTRDQFVKFVSLMKAQRHNHASRWGQKK